MDGYKPRPKKVPLYQVHMKLLSSVGPGNSMFLGRHVHTHRPLVLVCGPWGYILDGELYYGPYETYHIADILHTRHMKLISQTGSDLDLESVLEQCLLVRNHCGVPIEVRFVRGLMSRPQYFLWMDEPRNLLKSEVSHQLKLAPEIIDFLLPEKSLTTLNSSLPGNIKNSCTNDPQVVDNTSNNSPLTFVEE